MKVHFFLVDESEEYLEKEILAIPRIGEHIFVHDEITDEDKGYFKVIDIEWQIYNITETDDDDCVHVILQLLKSPYE